MSIAATPVDAGSWGEDDREAVVASYAGTIGHLAASLSAGPHDVPVKPAIECAHRILAAAVRKALAEAHARARVTHGLPEHDESHREVAPELAEEVLLRHSGGEIDDQSLQDLLVDRSIRRGRIVAGALFPVRPPDEAARIERIVACRRLLGGAA